MMRGLEELIADFHQRRMVLLQLRDQTIAQTHRLADTEATHTNLCGNLETLKKAIEAMKAALVPLTERGLFRLRQLLSYGLQVIFHDRDYSIEIEISERGNDKTAEFYLQEGEFPRIRLRDSVGGGILSVVSVVLRIFFILHYKDRRFLSLDEPGGDINARYIDGLFKFLQYVRDDLGFTFQIVTHEPRFHPYADVLYRVEHGGMKEVKRGS